MNTGERQAAGQAAIYEQIGYILVIRPQQELDHHMAEQVRKEADLLIERGKVAHLLFDFTDLVFMDSSGIGVIMGRYKKVIFQGGRIACCGTGSGVDRILKVSGLYRIMPYFPNREQALQYLKMGSLAEK